MIFYFTAPTGSKCMSTKFEVTANNCLFQLVWVFLSKICFNTRNGDNHIAVKGKRQITNQLLKWNGIIFIELGTMWTNGATK